MKVIARKHMPVYWPINLTAVIWLFMDRYSAPGWLHGVVWTIVGIYWVIAAWGIFSLQQQVELKELK